MAEKKEFLSYKGLPLVRKDNTIYYVSVSIIIASISS